MYIILKNIHVYNLIPFHQTNTLIVELKASWCYYKWVVDHININSF